MTEAPKDLAEIESIAHSYKRHQKRQGSEMMAIRDAEVSLVYRLLDHQMRLHEQRQRRIVLTVGSEAIVAVSLLGLGEDELAEPMSFEIEEGGSLSIVRRRALTDRPGATAEPYYGELAFVNFAAMSTALTTGGKLLSEAKKD